MYYLAGDEGFNFGFRHTGFEQHLSGLFAKAWRGATKGSRRSHQSWRHRMHGDGTQISVRKLYDNLPCVEVWVFLDVRYVIDGADRHVGVLEESETLLLVSLADEVRKNRFELRDVFETSGVGCEPRIGNKCRLFDGAEESFRHGLS